MRLDCETALRTARMRNKKASLEAAMEKMQERKGMWDRKRVLEYKSISHCPRHQPHVLRRFSGEDGRSIEEGSERRKRGREKGDYGD